MSQPRSKQLDLLTAPQRKSFDEFAEKAAVLFRAESKDAIIVRSLKEKAFQDRFLLRFLQRDDYKVDKALTRLQETMEWRIKQGLDEGKLDTAALKKAPGASPIYLKTPLRSKQGDIVFLDWIQLFDPSTITVDAHMKVYIATMEETVQELEDGQLVFAVINCEGLSWGISSATHIWHPLLEVMRKHYPEQVGPVIMLNTSTIFRFTFSVFKPLIGKKTLEKFKVWGPEYKEKITKFIDIEQLPIQWNMGGTYKADYGFGPGVSPLDGAAKPVSSEEDDLAQAKLQGLSLADNESTENFQDASDE